MKSRKINIDNELSPIIEKLSEEEHMLLSFGVIIFQIKKDKELERVVNKLLEAKIEIDKILDVLEIVLFQGGGLMTSKVRLIYQLLSNHKK